MKSYREELSIRDHKTRRGYINITREVDTGLEGERNPGRSRAW